MQQAVRSLYLSISHLLIHLDFVQQRALFIEEAKRKTILDNGFRFGELGREGIESYIDIAAQITNSKDSKKSVNLELFETYDSMPFDILSEYFNQPEVIKNLFKNAKALENHAYSKNFKPLSQLDSEILGIIYLLADFNKMDRRSLPFSPE